MNVASPKDERTTKLQPEHQTRARQEGEQKATNPSSDGSQQILSKIRQIKSEINDLKGRVNAQSGQAAKTNLGPTVTKNCPFNWGFYEWVQIPFGLSRMPGRTVWET